jgi:hypothetical protein
MDDNTKIDNAGASRPLLIYPIDVLGAIFTLAACWRMKRPLSKAAQRVQVGPDVYTVAVSRDNTAVVVTYEADRRRLQDLKTKEQHLISEDGKLRAISESQTNPNANEKAQKGHGKRKKEAMEKRRQIRESLDEIQAEMKAMTSAQRREFVLREIGQHVIWRAVPAAGEAEPVGGSVSVPDLSGKSMPATEAWSKFVEELEQNGMKIVDIDADPLVDAAEDDLLKFLLPDKDRTPEEQDEAWNGMQDRLAPFGYKLVAIDAADAVEVTIQEVLDRPEVQPTPIPGAPAAEAQTPAETPSEAQNATPEKQPEKGAGNTTPPPAVMTTAQLNGMKKAELEELARTIPELEEMVGRENKPELVAAIAKHLGVAE